MDLDFGLKMASDLRCGRITFKHEMCSVCGPSVVMIDAAIGAAIA